MSKDIPLPIHAELDWSEFLVASFVGCMREVSSRMKNHQRKHGQTDERAWIDAIEGSCGELALANYLGLVWRFAPGRFKGSDVGNRLQVRTRSKHEYELLVRDDDPDDDIFILLTGLAPSFSIRGWMTAKEAKNDQYLKDIGNGRPPAYFIPPADLHPISELKTRKMEDL